jgi:hypothetical protein
MTDEWIKNLWYIYTIEYFLTIRNNDMWFEGKWMQFEDIMLSEVSQDQKHKRLIFSLIHEHIHKNKHDHKNSVVEHVCNSGTTLWNLGKKGKEKIMIEHQ